MTSNWDANAVGGEAGAPELLLHGTDPARVGAILAEGLVPHEPGWAVAPDGRDYEPCAVYLTDSLMQARANSWKWLERPPRRRYNDGVLVVDVTGLPLLVLGFVTCFERIEPGRISRLVDHPARFRCYRQGSIAA
jgi:hypothetical protein